MQYQLHDCKIDSLVLKDNRIILSFPKGFYATDENGQELKPLRKKLAFVIDKGVFSSEAPDSFIFVRQIRRGGWKYISFKRFTSLFKKGNMVIHDEYDSKLTNWKMIQLNARTNCIELFITDIIDVECFE